MWIESQDLYTLIKCERLSIRQCGSKNFCIIGDERIVLGEYSSKWKALSVLYEIRSLLEYPSGVVFSMPLDEDVKYDG